MSSKINILATALLAFTACADYGLKKEAMGPKKIEQVLKEHTDELMSIPGVVGTAIGLCDERPCIKVYVVKKTPEIDQKIPDSLEGYPVMTEESGEFRKLIEDRD